MKSIDLAGLAHVDFAGLAQLVTALVLAATFVKTWINGRKTDAVAKAQLEIKENVQKIETATNSMKDALVEATARSSKAEGKAEGVEQERAKSV